MINRWLKFIQNLMSPCRCLLCDTPSQTGAKVCQICFNELPWLEHSCWRCALPLSNSELICGACLSKPPGFDRTQALWHYLPPVTGLIHALKFQRRQDLARPLGEMLAGCLRPSPLPDCLVPVPLHPTRYRARGFNQALEIARPIANRLKIPLCPKLCRRIRITPPQRMLDAEERRRNLRGAFQATTELSGRHIAIVDDVLTTGATAHEVATALKRAGAAHVEVWVLARA